MKYVGIIVAMTEEHEAIMNIMEETEKKSILGLDFIIGKIHEIDCILILSGVGKVNAARATQILIDKFDIIYVLNIGIAGALSYNLDIGDVIIGKSIVQHDFDITAFGHSKGYVPGIGNKLESDNELMRKIENIVKNSEERTYKIRIGTIATGDIFCTEVEMRNKILSKFKADCVEMEGAAVAQVCKLCDIPFIVIRSISDHPNGNNAQDLDKNSKLASRRSANILREFFTYTDNEKTE